MKNAFYQDDNIVDEMMDQGENDDQDNLLDDNDDEDFLMQEDEEDNMAQIIPKK